MDAKIVWQNALTEWSFARCYSEFLTSEAKSFAIISSWRANDEKSNPVSPQVNNAVFTMFRSEAGGVGQGVLELIGHCNEDAPGGTVDTTEPSLWVNGITLPDARSLSDRYGQRTFVYAGPETGVQLTLISKDGQSIAARLFRSQPLTADVIIRCWSEWRRRPFHFVELRRPVQNSVEGQVFQAQIADRVKALA
jgi:hypothetical protein